MQSFSFVSLEVWLKKKSLSSHAMPSQCSHKIKPVSTLTNTVHYGAGANMFKKKQKKPEHDDYNIMVQDVKLNLLSWWRFKKPKFDIKCLTWIFPTFFDHTELAIMPENSQGRVQSWLLSVWTRGQRIVSLRHIIIYGAGVLCATNLYNLASALPF